MGIAALNWLYGVAAAGGPDVNKVRSDMPKCPSISSAAPPSRVDRAPVAREARFGIGEVVRHRLFPFRGVVFDVDPEFANSEEWWESIPEAVRPDRAQPFYHLLAENEEDSYVAYVSQQNLIRDDSETPVAHPAIADLFEDFRDGRYRLLSQHRH